MNKNRTLYLILALVAAIAVIAVLIAVTYKPSSGKDETTAAVTTSSDNTADPGTGDTDETEAPVTTEEVTTEKEAEMPEDSETPLTDEQIEATTKAPSTAVPDVTGKPVDPPFVITGTSDDTAGY